jgi:hypothetical protein
MSHFAPEGDSGLVSLFGSFGHASIVPDYDPLRDGNLLTPGV